MSLAHRPRLPVHRLLCLVLAAALPAVPVAAGPALPSTPEGPAAAQRPQRCKPPTFGRDKLTVLCALAVAAAPQRIHIQVQLTGSHDDTTASLEVAIGDTPVACDAGSKSSTESEDGDLTLDCRFTVSVEPGAATVLRASAKWFHAQYVGLEVNGQRP